MIWQNQHETHKKYFLRGLRGLGGSILYVVVSSIRFDAADIFLN